MRKPDQTSINAAKHLAAFLVLIVFVSALTALAVVAIV